MLKTIIDIGAVLRASPDGLKHHRYIKKCPPYDEKKNPIKYWKVDVRQDGGFDFSSLTSLDSEYVKDGLFYLNYKTSDADSTKPYIFGDIYRSADKDVEDGNFRFGDPGKKSWMALNSFERAKGVEPIPTELVRTFRASFRLQIRSIEQFLRDHPRSYVHFSFAGKHWYELDELAVLNKSLFKTFFKQTQYGYVVDAALYKTLAAGASRTSGFQSANAFKNYVIEDESMGLDLLYGINYSSRAALRVKDFKLIVLPRGQNLTAPQIERFFEDEQTEEGLLNEAKSHASTDDIFTFLQGADHDSTNIVQFDFVFSKAGGTKADTDMIELSGLSRSRLSHIQTRIEQIRNDIETLRDAYFVQLYGGPLTKPLSRLNITRSFLNVLSNETRTEKKYQSHLLRVMPLIYTENYYQDPVLLPALIEKTEAGIRHGEGQYNYLRFDFIYLSKIQNYQGDRIMELQTNASYRVGVLLGKMGRVLRGKINSFDKNYAGLLSRRIMTVSDVKVLQVDFNQKLLMHDRAGVAYSHSAPLSEELKTLSDAEYDKSECACGFFESYFAPAPPKPDGSKPENSSGASDDDDSFSPVE